MTDADMFTWFSAIRGHILNDDDDNAKHVIRAIYGAGHYDGMAEVQRFRRQPEPALAGLQPQAVQMVSQQTGFQKGTTGEEVS